MNNTILNKVVITIIMVAIIGSMFVSPIICDSFSVNAASKKVKVKFNANGGSFVKQTAKKR